MTQGLLKQVTSPDSTNTRHLQCQPSAQLCTHKREEPWHSGGQGVGEGNEEFVSNGDRVSVGEGEKVLERDGGDGRTTM